MNLLFLNWLGGGLWAIPLLLLGGAYLSYKAGKKQADNGSTPNYWVFTAICVIVLIASLIYMYSDK